MSNPDNIQNPFYVLRPSSRVGTEEVTWTNYEILGRWDGSRGDSGLHTEKGGGDVSRLFETYTVT